VLGQSATAMNWADHVAKRHDIGLLSCKKVVSARTAFEHQVILVLKAFRPALTSPDAEVVGNLLASTQWLHLRDIDVIVADITNHIIKPSGDKTATCSCIVVSTRQRRRVSNHMEMVGFVTTKHLQILKLLEICW
jgi:hypothetical protein